jgi:preprotein translocase subunit YajC
MKRQKEQKKMIDALQAGDEVISVGGIVGKITKVGEQYVTLNVSSNAAASVEMLLQKGAVQTLLPKGTIKGL